MIASDSTVEKQVKALCALIGGDSLLVQGAGGNVSWKDDGVLWIKASGLWLAEAQSKDIFVPVDLLHLQSALAKQDFSVKPEVVIRSNLRPSIETLLHALMPHKVVVHLHAVEILVHLVRINARQKIQDLVGDAARWIFVDYFKPGAELAGAVLEELKSCPDADVVFMGNHGVLIGGANTDDVAETLSSLIFKLKAKSSVSGPDSCPATRQAEFLLRGYTLCGDREVNLLALKDELVNRLRYEWALYPDHVVFLGSEANILERDFRVIELDERARCKPSFIIAVGDGVYENLSVTPAQKSQLRCYFDVVSRQDPTEELSTLNTLQVSELLDWEAEKYRQSSINNKHVTA